MESSCGKLLQSSKSESVLQRAFAPNQIVLVLVLLIDPCASGKMLDHDHEHEHEWESV